MILILYSFYDEVKEETDFFNKLLSRIPSRMHHSVLKYKKIEDRWARLLGRLLVQTGLDLLDKKDGLSLEDVTYTAYNKPFIPNTSFEFTISHSGECVVCAMSYSYKLGIDIERIRDISIQNYFVNMQLGEQQRVSTASDILTEFYQFWTEKECVIKANGKGFFVPLNSFTVVNKYTTLENHIWFIKEVFINNNYVCNMAINDQSEKYIIYAYRINPAQLQF